MNKLTPIRSSEDLLKTLPIFPISGVVLLPRGQLPLKIFEPRYLAMTRDAMAGKRMIGMIQPVDSYDESNQPEVYKIGCVGYIDTFSETKDRQYLIALTGICRFDVDQELPLMQTGYRRVHACYDRYLDDFNQVKDENVDCTRLKKIMRSYTKFHDIDVNWDAIEKANGESLITCLAMICPFMASEKQAILESTDIRERVEVISTLMEMEILARIHGTENARH